MVSAANATAPASPMRLRHVLDPTVQDAVKWLCTRALALEYTHMMPQELPPWVGQRLVSLGYQRYRLLKARFFHSPPFSSSGRPRTGESPRRRARTTWD